MASPTALAATVGFIILRRGHAYITGGKITSADPELMALVMVLLWVVSYVGIWIFSFAHSYVLWTIKKFFDLSDELLARVDARLKWVLGILTTLGLIAGKLF